MSTLDHPFISIIVPNFNSGKLLQRLVNNLQLQTYENFEVLVQDGGSSDGSSEISMPENFNLKIEKDKGIYDAMNKAIARAKGSWLFFMGADDQLYEPSTLQKIVQILCSTSANLVYGNVIGDNNNVMHGSFDDIKILRQTIPHQAIFFKRPIFDLVGLYDIQYKIRGDYEWIARAWFDYSITFEYHDIIIANYAETGVSSQNEDDIFIKNLTKIFPINSRSDYSMIQYAIHYDLIKGNFFRGVLRLFKTRETIHQKIKHILYALKKRITKKT